MSWIQIRSTGSGPSIVTAFQNGLYLDGTVAKLGGNPLLEPTFINTDEYIFAVGLGNSLFGSTQDNIVIGDGNTLTDNSNNYGIKIYGDGFNFNGSQDWSTTKFYGNGPESTDAFNVFSAYAATKARNLYNGDKSENLILTQGNLGASVVRTSYSLDINGDPSVFFATIAAAASIPSNTQLLGNTPGLQYFFDSVNGISGGVFNQDGTNAEHGLGSIEEFDSIVGLDFLADGAVAGNGAFGWGQPYRRNLYNNVDATMTADGRMNVISVDTMTIGSNCKVDVASGLPVKTEFTVKNINPRYGFETVELSLTGGEQFSNSSKNLFIYPMQSVTIKKIDDGSFSGNITWEIVESFDFNTGHAAVINNDGTYIADMLTYAGKWITNDAAGADVLLEDMANDGVIKSQLTFINTGSDLTITPDGTDLLNVGGDVCGAITTTEQGATAEFTAIIPGEWTVKITGAWATL